MLLSRSFALVTLTTLVATASIAHSETSFLPSTIVAKQGDATVTLDDVDAFADRMPAEKRAAFFSSPSRIEGVISNLLLQKQLSKKAIADGLEAKPDVERDIALARQDVLSRVAVEEFRKNLKIPDFSELAQEEYLAHKSKYVVPGALVVQQILVDTKARSDQEAKNIAQSVVAEARAHPDQFDELVEKYSDDPTKKTNKGIMADAGDATKYVAEFSEAARALKRVNEISEPVKTPYGYHVLKLVERRDTKQNAFATVKDEITAHLRSDYVEKEVRTYTDTLRNLPIDANPELVGSLRSRYGTAPTPIVGASAR